MSKPYPPRDILGQSSSRSVLFTWKLAEKNDDQKFWNVYSPDETTMFDGGIDRATRQVTIPCSAGSSINVFISAVNDQGEESQKVQAQGSATAEASAPSVPSTPPGYSTESSGGGDTSTSRGGRLFNGGTSA